MSSRWNLIAQITDLHIKRPGELAYQKESFYNGLRALLEISRDGVSKR